MPTTVLGQSRLSLTLICGSSAAKYMVPAMVTQMTRRRPDIHIDDAAAELQAGRGHGGGCGANVQPVRPHCTSCREGSGGGCGCAMSYQLWTAAVRRHEEERVRWTMYGPPGQGCTRPREY